jgi:hypothetical protein
MRQMSGRYRTALLMIVVAVTLVSGCGNNTAPPEYIKDLVIYTEGNGIVAYMMLCDKDGRMTSVDGKVELRIWSEYEETYWVGYDMRTKQHSVPVFSATTDISKAQFYKTEVGMGSLAHEVFLYSFGRIDGAQLNLALPEDEFASDYAEVVLTCADGKTLQLKVDCFLPR